MDILNTVKKVHFIGIGGIGISAIARMLMAEGKKVSGSDIAESEITKALRKLGAEIYINAGTEHVTKEVDLIIYTVAIPDTHPELGKARELEVQALSYPEVLGLISKNKFTIAISGTHGKTTTTAMIGKILIDAGINPTVIVGSLITDENGTRTNFIPGKSNYLVVEACEYKRSFLQINPTVLVITNIDDDHLDYYKDIGGVKQGFRDFLGKLPNDGIIVANPNLQNVSSALDGVPQTILDYSSITEKIELQIPGQHNRENAKVALTVAGILDIPKEKALTSLKNFKGTWRRFELKGTMKNGVRVYDDYGHHPTEVRATLKGARELFPDKKITIVFQPHLYSRTREHLLDFPKSFDDADKIIIAPIYAAREPEDKTISNKILAEKIGRNALAPNSFEEILEILKNETESNEIVITMGAGDIYKLGEALLLGND